MKNYRLVARMKNSRFCLRNKNNLNNYIEKPSVHKYVIGLLM